jgi:hypothetical protein
MKRRIPQVLFIAILAAPLPLSSRADIPEKTFQNEHNTCQSRVPAILIEKAMVERYYFDRIARQSPRLDPSVTCLLYSAWDHFLSLIGSELEICHDSSEAQGVIREAFELHHDIGRVLCRPKITNQATVGRDQ